MGDNGGWMVVKTLVAGFLGEEEPHALYLSDGAGPRSRLFDGVYSRVIPLFMASESGPCLGLSHL